MEETKNTGGRPNKSDDEKREIFVRVRFCDTEYKRLLERKQLTLSKDLSTFIRSVCLDKPLRMKPQLTSHQEQVLSIIREFRADMLRVGVNINQSSRRINSTTDYHDLQREVNAMADNVKRIEAQFDSLTALIQTGDSLAHKQYGSSD